jgi:Zn-dependent peptidase ImmA (M78 family)
MITVNGALKFTEDHFPQGPESLIEFLGIKVRYNNLSGTEGWCIPGTEFSTPIIRINNKSSKRRQRFTLAHELAHLILGIPGLVNDCPLNPNRKSSEAEREVDNLASQLLLPEEKVIKHFRNIPITAKDIKKFANKARISEVVVTLRLASLAPELKLNNALVLFYQNRKFKWQWSKDLVIERNDAALWLENCLANDPNPFCIQSDENEESNLACIVKNPFFNTITIFLQIVPTNTVSRGVSTQSIKEIAYYLFEGNKHLENRLNGCLGAFNSKNKNQNLTLEKAERMFHDEYLNGKYKSWSEKELLILTSRAAQEYIHLRLAKLFPDREPVKSN